MINQIVSRFSQSQPGGIQQTNVQVLDGKTFAILFASASPMRVSVNESYKPTKFEVESGEQRSDHIVKQAIEISMDFMLTDENARDQFDQLRQAARDHVLVTIQTRLSSYDNMLMETLSSDEVPDIQEGASVPIKFTEWRETQPEYGELKQSQVADSKQSSSVKRGKQTGKTASPDQEQKRKTSMLGGWGII